VKANTPINLILVLALILMGLIVFSCDRGADQEAQRRELEAEKALRAPKPDPGCTGLPKEKRVKVLGFELGSCLYEVQATVESLGLKLEGEKNPNTPKLVWPFVLRNYAGAIFFDKPQEKLTLFMFDQNQVLFALRANYIYKKKYKEAKRSFAALDRALSNKYGQAQMSPFTKRWQNNQLSVELKFSLDVKSNSTILVSYFLNEISRTAIGWPKEN